MFLRPDLVIDARVRQGDEALRLDCTFTNRGRRPLYVFTCVASVALEPLPHRAYTAFRDKDQALHVFLGIPPIPKGVRVYAKVVPLTTLVKPGASVADYYELPVPVAEWQPYADPEAAADVDVVEARKLLVSTEYFDDQKLLRRPRWDAAAGYFKALGVPLRRAPTEVMLPKTVEIQKRRDEFASF